MKATVKVENLKIYSYHGCMKEEEIIGSDYVVNIKGVYTLDRDRFEDRLSQTVDYVILTKVAREEMGVRSKTIESVVKRICQKSLLEAPLLEEIEVSVSKICPPINADVERVTVSLTKKRNKR